MKSLAVILRKEFRQFFNNAFLPKLCLMFPIIVMLVMPLVTNMEVRNVGVVIVDHDHSTFSRKIAADIGASTFTTLAAVVDTYDSALRLVEKGDADVVLEIPAGFLTSLAGPDPLQLFLSANAVNATKGSLGMQYVRTMLARQLQASAASTPATSLIAVKQMQMAARSAQQQGSVVNHFNPTLDYRIFMIPAQMIMLLVMLCGFLPALNLVGEKEVGTIEQINVSPVSQLTFTLGKVLPYWIIGFVVINIAMLIAWAVYGLAPLGSLLTIYAATALFVIVMSCMAVIMANFSDNMQQVMLVMFFFVMIFILMSGLLTPIQSMPEWARDATAFIPARYYVDIMRATYLRGTSMAEQSTQFISLAAFALLFIITAILTYRKRN